MLPASLTNFADASSAQSVIRDYVSPVLHSLTLIGGTLCALALAYAGFLYTTSNGNTERLDLAKRIIKGALIGVAVVAASGLIYALLSHAYSTPSTPGHSSVPKIDPLVITPSTNGFVDLAIQGIAGLLSTIVQSIGTPLTTALTFFTSSTELMSQNSAVFDMWFVTVTITDSLFVLVIALLGFKLMSGAALGLEEVELKKMLPQLALIFLVMNSSLFLIDALINLSNVMIKAVHSVAGPTSLFDSINTAIGLSTGQNIVAIILLVVFVIAAVILVVYYIVRLITLYIGAVLSPLVALLWLVPGFRDFAETAMKTYIVTIFVLFVHVIILQLAASLIGSISVTKDPTLIVGATFTALAAIVALLKTQHVMSHYSLVSGGTKNAKRLGSDFARGVGFLASKGKIGKLGPIRGTASAHKYHHNWETSPSTVGVERRPAASASDYHATSSPYEQYHPHNNAKVDSLMKNDKPPKEPKS